MNIQKCEMQLNNLPFKIDNQSIAIKNLDDIVVGQKQQNIKTLELGVDKDIELTNAPHKPIQFNGNTTRLKFK